MTSAINYETCWQQRKFSISEKKGKRSWNENLILLHPDEGKKNKKNNENIANEKGFDA